MATGTAKNRKPLALCSVTKGGGGPEVIAIAKVMHEYTTLDVGFIDIRPGSASLAWAHFSSQPESAGCKCSLVAHFFAYGDVRASQTKCSSRISQMSIGGVGTSHHGTQTQKLACSRPATVGQCDCLTEKELPRLDVTTNTCVCVPNCANLACLSLCSYGGARRTNA